jgi:hypothetical protein
MKNFKNYLAIIILNIVGIVGNAQTYSFPVRPGDEEWKSIKNSDEKYSACQIPNEILESMSTKDLINTCLSYPLIGTLYAYNDLQSGFEALTKKFNGIQELIRRKDSGVELVKIYSNMRPDNYDSEWSNEKKGDYTFEFSYIETFLAQKPILLTLSLTDRKKLVILCIDKYNTKQQHIDIYGTAGTSTTAWVIGRTLEDQRLLDYKESNNELAVYTFLERGLVIDFEVVDDIIQKGENFIK